MSYDPTIGRFISEDPIAFEGGDANLYRYAGNDPANFADPSGLQVPMTARPPRPQPPSTSKPKPAPPGSPTNPLPWPTKGPVIAPPSSAQTNNGSNSTSAPSPLPPGTVVGVTGADPCVGVIMVPPAGSGKPYVMYHFATGYNDYYRLMKPFAEQGYYIIITGGGKQNQVVSTGNGIADWWDGDFHTGKKNLERACRAARSLYDDGGPLKQFDLIPYPSVGIDKDGNIYVIGVPGAN